MDQDMHLSDSTSERGTVGMPSSPGSAGESESGDGAVPNGDPTYVMTKEHAAAFKKVMEKKRIIWCDYAAAFDAALQCVNTKQSQDFAIKFIPKALPFLTGEGEAPPPQAYGHQASQTGSAWDDWCGENRRKGDHPAEDQTKYFQTALICAVKLVLHSLDRGSAELIDALDTVLDKNSAIYSFRREQNAAAHNLALALYADCTRLWQQGGGPQKRLNLLDKAPWNSLTSLVKTMDNTGEAGESSDILNRVALRIEKADAKEISDACNACQKLITHFKKENQPSSGQSTLLMGVSKSLGFPKSNPRKQFRQRLKAALKQLALRGSKSSVWAQRREALESLAYVIKNEKEYKESNGHAMCMWLEDHQVLEDLFGERAHATIVSETVGLLSLIELTDARVNVLVDSALMHVGSVRAEVHKVIIAVLSKCESRAARVVLNRIMGVFDVPDVLKSDDEFTGLGTKPSSPAFVGLAALHSGDCLQAAFELVTAIFDTSKLHGLFTTVDVMMKGTSVAFRAMDVLVAALLTPFCEDQEVFNRLVQDSLFHCLQSTWGEVDGAHGNGQGKQCKEYVAHLCCRIVQNKGGATSQMAMKGAFAVLMEVIRLFPRSNFASQRDITREACIHELQTQFDVLQACMLNLRSLSQSLDSRVMESDDVLHTELWTRLGQLRYLLENTSADQKEYNIMLESRQVDQLWEALNGGTECCLRWLRLAADSGGIFDDTTQVHLFRRFITKMDCATIRPHGFNCFQALFADVNNATLAWETSGRSGQKSGCKINGPAFVGRRVRVLWKDEKMHNGTICSYSPPTPREPKVQRHTVRWDDTGKEDTHDWTDLHDWHLLEDELSVNILAYEILHIQRAHALEGLDFLWDCCLVAHDDVVATKAHDMMLDLTRHMPAQFQQEVLQRLSETLQKTLQATDVDSRHRTQRVRRCLQLIKNLLRGQIRICDAVFSYTQYAKSRSHGFRGYGKKMTISLIPQREDYKSASNAISRQVEVGSRQELDEIIARAYPQHPPARVAVMMNGNLLVRGPKTTLEELGVTDGAELRIEYDNRTNVPESIAFGHIGETIAREPSIFKMLFEILDEQVGLQDMQGLVWEVLMTLPTQQQDNETVTLNRAQWRSVVMCDNKIWRSLYLLQIVKSELERPEWRAEFLSHNGFAMAVELMEEVHKRQIQAAKQGLKHQANLLRDTGMPIVLRVIRLCTGEQGQIAQPVITSPTVPTALAKTCQLIILLSSKEPLPPIVSAIIDGAQALSVFLSGVGAPHGSDPSIFTNFFVPRAAAYLAELQLGPSEVQESSRMASDAGILVHKLLLQYEDSKVRVAIADVLLEIAASSTDLGTQLVDLMCECLNVKHNECTRCKQFFMLLTRLLTSTKPVLIRDQPNKMYKAAELSTTMLLHADKLPLSNEMLYEVMTLLNHTMLRPDASTKAPLAKLASQLMPKLSKEFLMRAPGSKRSSNVARTMARRSNLGQNSHLQVAPLCESAETREAAWCLLHTVVTQYSQETMVSLADYIYEFAQATRLPVKIHWNRMNSTPKEDWEHRATVDRRKLACVGLKNQGATCYMNAMMQQLFLDDSLRKTILTAPLAAPPPEKAEELWKCPICTLENDWGSRVCMACEQGERPEKVDPVPHGDLLRQMQRTFRFMVDSELQSFDPIQLVDACRDLGLHFRVTSQNDSSEFLDKLLERLEREVGGKEHSESLKSCFRVRVSSQLVSVECPHRKPINPGVFEKSFKVNVERMGTLERAIEDALAGELMTGDSRVDCEKCTMAAQAAAVQNGSQPEDRATQRAMKRTLFLDGDNLPSTLCIQLNRFQFQGNGFVKLNDRLAFNTVLDLAPYTKPPKGQEGDSDEDMSEETKAGGGPQEANSKRRIDTDEPLLYELKGIVVHSGQFSFGHYYSFAKDPITGKWLKLDDDQVSEFDLADLESECFGGIQTTVNKWTNCVYKTEKTASAYMLFYQRSDGVPISTPKKERTAGPREAATPDSVSDTLMDDLQIESPATASLEKVESAAGVDEILDTNEQMLRRSLFFDEGFSSFVLDLLVAMDAARKISKETIDMALTVFYKSVLHAEGHPRLQTPGGFSKTDWVSMLRRLLRGNEEACISFLEMCTKVEDGPDHLRSWLEGGLVSCPIEEVRQSFGELIYVAVRTLAARAEADAKFKSEVSEVAGEFVEALKQLVPALSHSWRHLAQFGVLVELMGSLPLWCEVMVARDMLAQLLHLYLGQASPGIKFPQHFPKIASMGTSNNAWSSGRLEPDCDALLRGIELLYTLRAAPGARWSRLTGEMVSASIGQLAQKLCTTDPMGGGGDRTQPLLIHIIHSSLQPQGNKHLVEQIRNLLVEQLEKQSSDFSTRVRQSQTAQALACFLRCPGEAGSGQDAQWLNDLHEAKALLLRQLLLLELYQSGRNVGLNPAKRFAQVLILAGVDAQVCSLLQQLVDQGVSDLNPLASALVQEQGPRHLSGQPPLVVAPNSDARTQLAIMESSMTRARQAHLPAELYVSVTAHDAAVKGVYRLDGQGGNASQAEQSAGPSYIKTIGNAVAYHISKEILSTSNEQAGDAAQAERWLLTCVDGAKAMTLYQTAPRHLSADRCPPPTARWRRVAAHGEAGDVESDMVVMAQWCDDVSYTRRNADYSNVNCCVDSNCKMDVGPNNDNKAVHFGGEDASDSASDEAIAGSDHEGGDEQTGHVDRQ